jgi:3-hydroxyisobutyrate dehydrogenase-like beta-hydroxyacid dehydrogenase
MTIVAVIAPGNMGAAVGGRLTACGASVRTLLDGRGSASVERAKSAGMIAATPDEIAASDFILSIVPPDRAIELAERLAPALAAATRKPVFADCNAVSPATTGRIAAIVSDTGALYADACIIGFPPSGESSGPNFYASGEHAPTLMRLQDHGLNIKVLAAPIGAASALKMSYAGISKGQIALASAMSLAAIRAGVSVALKEEMASSQKALSSRLPKLIPGMFGKAARWVPEMNEIAGYLNEATTDGDIFEAIAAFYARIAEGVRTGSDDIAALDALWTEVDT